MLYRTAWRTFSVIAQADGPRITRVDSIAYDKHGAPDELVLSARGLRGPLEQLRRATAGAEGQLWRVAVAGVDRVRPTMTIALHYGDDAAPYLMSPDKWADIATTVYPGPHAGAARQQPPASWKLLGIIFAICLPIALVGVWFTESARAPVERVLVAVSAAALASVLLVFLTARAIRKEAKSRSIATGGRASDAPGASRPVTPVRGGALRDRYHVALRTELAKGNPPYDGFVVFTFVEEFGSVCSTRAMMLTAGHPPRSARMSCIRNAFELGYDVLDDANTHGAAEAAMVTTYRCLDDSWTMATHVGLESHQWRATPGTIRDLVEQVRPV